MQTNVFVRANQFPCVSVFCVTGASPAEGTGAQAEGEPPAKAAKSGRTQTQVGGMFVITRCGRS